MKISEFSGVKIAVGKREELFSCCELLVGVGGAIFTPNLQILKKACESARYKEILNTAQINIPDSVGVKCLLAAQGVKTDTLAGVELGERLILGRSFAIIGGRAGRAEMAGNNLLIRHPSARFLFSFSGYGYDEEKIRQSLAAYKPDICIVCLGAPKQELFINRVRSASERTLFLGLGGSVDVYSGASKRAPKLFRHLGCEWLYRCACEPKRMSGVMGQFCFFLREFFAVLNKKE